MLSPPLRRLLLAGFSITTIAAPAALCGPLPTGFQVVRAHAGVNFPSSLRFAPDGRLFFTELTGRVAYYPSLSYPNSVTWDFIPVKYDPSAEWGNHGIAFHPDFADSPYVYVSFSNLSPLSDRLVRYTDKLGVASDSTLMMSVPAGSSIHHGGRVEFGPDGMIYWSYGDQQDMSAAQDPSALSGKIFRLGRGGRPAPGNPWGPSNPAIVMGIRNVFGLSFDPLSGIGYFTENGPDCDDEANLMAFGANYGWGPSDDCGTQPAGTFPALASFTPTIAPTGCCLYRGSAYPSRYDGTLFFGSWNESRLYRARFKPGQPDQVDTVDVFCTFDEPVLDVTEGPDGFLWVATAGSIWRITYTGLTIAVEDPPATPVLSLGIAPNPSYGMVAQHHRCARGRAARRDRPAGSALAKLERSAVAPHYRGRPLRARRSGTGGRLSGAPHQLPGNGHAAPDSSGRLTAPSRTG
jgi:glucose/arabinose dehydrogenase